MTINIKSEIDSRVLLYPLMQACNVYGSVLVLTSNKYARRIIDDQEFDTFRNIVIIVDESGSTDDLVTEYGIAPDDYDYVIVDNMGVADYDKCFCLFGQKQSSAFMEDKAMMEGSENVENIVFLEYGKKAARAPRPEKAPKAASARKTGTLDSGQEVPEDYDPSAKFRDLIDEEKRKSVASYSIPFPSFEMIEKLEGCGKFEPVEEKLCPVFYEVFGKDLNIQYNIFRKEIRHVNEGSSNNKSGRAGR